MSTYHNLKAVVRVSGSTSDTLTVKRSVRQGGVLSTFLFLVYVNDLLNDIERSGCGSKVMFAFADDVSLLALTPVHLQKMVDIMYDYCQHWKVYIKDARSVSLYLYNRSQILQYVKYTK